MNILYSIKDFLYYNRYKIIGIVGVLFFFFYFKDYLLNMDQNETEKIVEIEEINKEEISNVYIKLSDNKTRKICKKKFL